MSDAAGSRVSAQGQGPLPRRFGRLNGRGLATLWRRDVVRFLRYGVQSLGGPCVSSLLLLAVFTLAGRGNGEMAPGLSIAAFIVPGIVVFQLSHAAFQSTAVAIIHDKHGGMIADLLVAPLSPLELLLGYVLSAVFSASLVALATLLAMLVFVDIPFPAPAVALLFLGLTALLFALLGTLVGLWAERWEHYSAADTFLILPLGLLSGCFFTLASLPPSLRQVIEVNPVFHAVNGFRYGLTGFEQGSLMAGVLAILLPSLLLALLVWRLVARGYKIKA